MSSGPAHGDQGRTRDEAWNAVLKAGVQAQRLVPGCVAVGGTAAALYARHRVSLDTDHVLPDLRSHFQETRDVLESFPSWKTARVQPPVLILGSIDGVEVGFRQSRRSSAIETVAVATPAGSLVVPTLDEMIGMKAFMAMSRGATRDFIDFAALSRLAGPGATLASLLKTDRRYSDVKTGPAALAVAAALSSPAPYDLGETDLARYKGLDPAWHQWVSVESACIESGRALSKALILDGTNDGPPPSQSSG